MQMLLNRIFRGRTGIDQLNRVLLVLAVLLFFGRQACMGMVSHGAAGVAFYMLFRYATLLTFAIFIVRAFSRNLGKRQEENQRFLQWIHRRGGGSQGRQTRRAQRKAYKVFSCPSCRQKLRVPRGKGKVQVTCRQCGAIFEKKT